MPRGANTDSTGNGQLVPITHRTPRERLEISRKGGRATKGLTRPDLWTCKSCRYAKDKTCQLGLNMLKNAGKTITDPETGKTLKVPENPKCMFPEAKKALLGMAANPAALLNMIQHHLTEGSLKARTMNDNLKVADTMLRLANYIEPPLQRTISLTANMDVGKAMEVVYRVLMRKKTWRRAIDAIRDEMHKEMKGGAK